MRKLTTEEFVTKARTVHKDTYDYSKTIYVNARTKLHIICKKHGEFFQFPSVHMNGNGCSKCSGKKQHTTVSFIESAKIVHKGKYIYTDSIYTLGKNKITIICPIHGTFEQIASDHLSGHGCKDCSSELIRNSKILSKDNFITMANTVHINKYLYTYTNYNNRNDLIIITCPEHGEFEQSPKNHLRGSRCPECSLIEKKVKLSSNKENFIKDALKIHGTVYNYDKTRYVHSKQKVIITCSEHGDFEQIPNTHLQGSGCPLCANHGFDQTKPAYLYYLKIATENDQVLYKIGITNKTVDERFQLNDLKKIEVIKQKLYEKGIDALNWEQKLLKQYKKYQYKGPDILSSGNTELFIEDIMTLYYNA